MIPISPDYGSLQQRLGYTFRNQALLEQALTHRSFVHEHPEAGAATNERLEFLGDAIFQFLVAERLFRRFPDATEGRLTAVRAALVSTESFADVGEALELAGSIRNSRGEATVEGRGRQSILAGCVEALVAAVYVDAGWEEATRLVHRLIDPRIEEAAEATPLLNVKGRLQERIQAAHGVTPTYRVLERSGPVHAEHFVVEVVAGEHVLGRGEGVGKRRAEVEAARHALASLVETEPASQTVPGGSGGAGVA